MKKIFEACFGLALSASALACNEVPDSDNPSFPEAGETKALLSEQKAAELAKPSHGVGATSLAPIRADFRVPAVARSLTGGTLIRRRAPGYRFSTGTVPKLAFAAPTAAAASARLREATKRFFATAAPAFAAQMGTAALTESDGVWRLGSEDAAGFAYMVPQSGAFTLKRALPPEKRTIVRDAEDAVAIALSQIVEHELLTVAPNEALDVVGVTARYFGATDDSGPKFAEKVGYKVLFGRTYRGVPVMGPTTLVSLDSDGKVVGFRKGWRDLEAEVGSVEVASEAVIESRRDALMITHLTAMDSTCGYAEDSDPGAVQVNPGIGCRYMHEDPNAEALNREVEDWVNAAKDMSLGLRGIKPSNVAVRP